MAPKVTSKPPAGKTSKKPTPRAKQPISAADRLRRLFKTLCAQIDGGHFKNAIKTSEKILVLNPGDEDATQTKLYLLLHAEQYNTALDMTNKGKDGDLAFEKAYALYRLQREQEAHDAIVGAKSRAGVDMKGFSHLEAQLNYRDGSFQAAFDMYNELLDSTGPQTDEHSDILNNLKASQTHLDFINNEFLHSLDKLPAPVSANIEALPPPAPVTSPLAAALQASSSQITPAEGDAVTKEPKKSAEVACTTRCDSRCDTTT